MIKRSILVENKTVIITKNLQLFLKSETRESSITIEDIGFIIIDNAEVYHSIPDMNLLIENNTSIIICGNNHLSNGILLNLNSPPLSREYFRVVLHSIKLNKILSLKSIY